MINKGEEQRAHLIMKLRGQGIRSASVLSAIESVPRDIFIENALKNHAWENVTLPIGEGQTISQPYIVALMTTALNLSGKEIVLEIGTGSGYQASILSLLCRRVYTIERIKTLHEFSNKKFKELKLNNIKIVEQFLKKLVLLRFYHKKFILNITRNKIKIIFYGCFASNSLYRL